MHQGLTMLDIQKALAYMTEDPRAGGKMGLGAVATLAPILNLAAIGYQVEVARRVARGEPQPLPEWDDLKRLWVQGAWLGLALYLYSLPLLLFVLGCLASVFVGFVLALQSDAAQTGASLAAPPVLVIVIFIVLTGLAVLYSFFLGLLRPAILAEYAQRGTFRACFDFRAMWRFIRHNPGEYLLLWLTEAVVGWVIGVPLFFVVFIVLAIPFVGPLLLPLIAAAVGFYLFLVSGHLVGQLLRARAPATA
jgi:hypothetical protein